MNKNNKKLKIAAVAIFFLFIGASVVQAVVLKNTDKIADSQTNNEQIISLNGGSIFTWEDDFLDWSKIDNDKSSNIDVVNNKVVMKHAYKAWHWAWPKMKEIQIQNSGSTKNNYVLYLDRVYHTPEMEPDYSDLRFVSVDNNGVVSDLDYWIGTDYTSSSAEVWVRIPRLDPGENSIYMFYGATAPWDNSNYKMIFRWDDRTDPDIMISYKAYQEGAWDPDVAYGGGRFLVAWEERVGPEDQYNQLERSKGCCIHGRTYKYDGTDPQPSGDADIDITPAQPPDWSYHAQNPSIAYGSGKFFIVWEENPATILDRFEADIKGAFVTTGGSVTRLSSPICSASNLQVDPCVTYANNKFFVAWEDARATFNNYNVWGRIYHSSGSPATNEFQITSGANYEGEPWVCADDDGSFMVVYEKGINPTSGPFSIYAQKFNSNGGNVMSEKLIASGSSSEDYIFPSVNYNPSNNGRYLIAWNSGEPGLSNLRDRLDGNVMGKIINKDGTETSNFYIQPGDHYIRTDVAPFLGDMFFVAYDGSTDLWGKLVYSEDIKTGEQALSDGSSLNIDWNNLAVDNDHDHIMAVWEDERDVASQYADTFGSVWNIYKTSGSADVSYQFSSPRDMYTDAVLMSKVISADDVQQWQTFEADYSAGTGSIDFDVMNSQGTSVLYPNLGDISNVNVGPIRLRAKFHRDLPNADPYIDKWKVTYIGIDRDPPTTEIFKNPENPDGNNQWYISPVEITLLGLDGEGSGVETNHYIIDGGSEQVSNNNPCSFTIWNSGDHTIEYWSVDYAENVGQHKQISLKIDTNKPTVDIIKPEDESEIPPGNIIIEAEVSEDESGNNKVQFLLNGELKDETSEDKETYYFSFTGAPAMMYSIVIKAYDIAGNYGSDRVDIQTQSEDKIYEYTPKIGYWYTNTGSDDSLLLLILSCSLVITRELDIKIKPPDALGPVDHVTFEIRGRQTYEGTEYAPDSGGFFKYKFDPPTWLYGVKATMFDSSNTQIEEFRWSGKVIFINTL